MVIDNLGAFCNDTEIGGRVGQDNSGDLKVSA
jgi:hypothetical protein